MYGDQARFFEMENKPRIKHTKMGTLSMVNNGENMHGSQVYIYSTGVFVLRSCFMIEVDIYDYRIIRKY